MRADGRACLAVAALLSTIALAPTSLRAEDYPSQDLHFITSFPPGSGADVLTRFFAEKVRALTGRTVIVENKSGANGAIAVQYTAQAKPDGYTMYLSAGSATAAQMHLFKVPPVNVLKAFQLAATINRQAFMLTVDAKTPYRNVPELTAAMKQKGKAATYATAATSGIIMGEMYKSITGVEAVEVRYKDSSGALNDMASGRVDYGMHDPVFSLAQQREGRLLHPGAQFRSAPRRDPRHPHHGGIGRAGHGSHFVVGGDAAERDAAAGCRSDQRVVQPDPRNGGYPRVPQQVRRRPVCLDA